jgi:hypothetical protein
MNESDIERVEILYRLGRISEEQYHAMLEDGEGIEDAYENQDW